MANNRAPRVSVLMPTFNYARFISEAIESVVVQTFRDLELLVVDNCSTDDTAERVQRLALQDRRIRFIRNETNLGMVGNWNRCLALASGEYVKFMFSDDAFRATDALERMVRVLDADRSVALVASSRALIDDASKPLGPLSEHRGALVQEGTRVIKDCLMDQKNTVGEPTAVLFRKDQARRGFDARYRQLVDLEMWFHLLEQGKFGYLPEPLVCFRQHPEQQTHLNIRNAAVLEDPFLLLDDYGGRAYLGLSPVERAYLHYVPLYEIWKAHAKHGQLTRTEAIERIGEHYPVMKFFALFPLFKLRKYLRRKARARSHLPAIPSGAPPIAC